jgi:hypothetical protein
MSKERRFFIGDREFFIPITPAGDYHTMARWVDHMNTEKRSPAGRWTAGGKEGDVNLLLRLGELGVIDSSWFLGMNVVDGYSWWRWANTKKLLKSLPPDRVFRPYKSIFTYNLKSDSVKLSTTHDSSQSFFLSTTNHSDL